MRIARELVELYTQPGALTTPGKYADMLAQLPEDAGAIARVVQGLVVHEFVAAPFYGVTIPDERKSESHIRRVEQMLDRLLAGGAPPLTVSRPPAQRLVGVCHHFALLFVAMLRAKGIPARARWGFGSYFNPGFYEDHVLVEYWKADAARWARGDAQLDDIWQERARIDFDALDVPDDRFLIAADAWARCRGGVADASKFGIVKGNLRGLWFVASSLVRDLATLNKMELLPWDTWGAMPAPNEALAAEQLAFFDKVAALTRAPDATFTELRALYENDERLRVPPSVFNALLNRPEAI